MLITIWYKTLTAVNDASRLLQSEVFTIDDKLLFIGQLLEDLKGIRGSWSQIFQEAVVVVGPLGFESELATKSKRKPKRFRDEASNTAHFYDNQKKEFEVNIFNIGLDSLIQKIDLRFEASRMVGDMFSFIWLDNDDLSIQEKKAREFAGFYPRDVNKDNLIEKVCRFNTPHKSYDDVIDIWAARKARKIHLLNRFIIQRIISNAEIQCVVSEIDNCCIRKT